MGRPSRFPDKGSAYRPPRRRMLMVQFRAGNGRSLLPLHLSNRHAIISYGRDAPDVTCWTRFRLLPLAAAGRSARPKDTDCAWHTQLRPAIRRLNVIPRRSSSSFTFSRRRSATRRRRREFSLCKPRIWFACSRSSGRGGDSAYLAGGVVGRTIAPRALRQR
jgi:hypothetical protein